MVVGVIIGAILAAGLAAYATYPTTEQEAIRLGVTQAGTASTNFDMVQNNGCHTGVAWVRSTCTSGGVPVVTTCATTTINRVTVTAAATAVPAAAQANKTQICIFNQDTVDTIYCLDGVATLLNGAMIEPRTGRCFGGTEAFQCISDNASGDNSTSVDAVECGP